MIKFSLLEKSVNKTEFLMIYLTTDDMSVQVYISDKLRTIMVPEKSHLSFSKAKLLL